MKDNRTKLTAANTVVLIVAGDHLSARYFHYDVHYYSWVPTVVVDAGSPCLTIIDRLNHHAIQIRGPTPVEP